MKRFVPVFLLMGALLLAGGANAAMEITFAEVGSDVVATAAGTLTLPGTPTSGTASGQIWPDQGRLVFGGSGVAAQSLFCVLTSTAPVAFGSGSITSSSNSTGQVFGFNSFSSLVYVPTGFTNGGSINSTVTFPNITLASLGLNSGNTVYTCGTDTITIVGPQAVPTLSEWAQLLLALMVMTLIGWHFHRARSY